MLCLRTHFLVLAACPYNRLLRIVLRLFQISQPHIASQLRSQQQPLQLALSMKDSAGDGAIALAPVSLGVPMSARCDTERRKVDAH